MPATALRIEEPAQIIRIQCGVNRARGAIGRQEQRLLHVVDNLNPRITNGNHNPEDRI